LERKVLTEDDNKEIYSQNREPLADSIIRMLEESLHDGSVDLHHDDSRQTGKEHPNKLY
jgi:hypothetical protein